MKKLVIGVLLVFILGAITAVVSATGTSNNNAIAGGITSAFNQQAIR